MTLLSGGTAPDFGTAFTAFWLTNPETAQLIYFVGLNQVHEYSHVNGVWSDQVVPTPFVPVFETGMYAIDGGYSFHVLYLTPNVNTGSEDVIEAWRPYNLNNWTVNNLTPQGQLTPEAISGSSLSGSPNNSTFTYYVAQSTTPSIYVLYTTSVNKNGHYQWASQQAVQLPLFESTLLSSFYW